MRAYSADLRERVLADCDAGLPTAEVAARFRVSASWVRRLKQRRRETGEVAPRAQKYGPTPRAPRSRSTAVGSAWTWGSPPSGGRSTPWA